MCIRYINDSKTFEKLKARLRNNIENNENCSKFSWTQNFLLIQLPSTNISIHSMFNLPPNWPPSCWNPRYCKCLIEQRHFETKIKITTINCMKYSLDTARNKFKYYLIFWKTLLSNAELVEEEDLSNVNNNSLMSLPSAYLTTTPKDNIYIKIVSKLIKINGLHSPYFYETLLLLKLRPALGNTFLAGIFL